MRQGNTAGRETAPERLWERAGSLFFSPVLPLAACILILAAIFLRMEAVQTALILFGERLIGRGLTREVWYARFSHWAAGCLTYGGCVLFSSAAIFAYRRCTGSREFDWKFPFAFIAVCFASLACVLPSERLRHIALILAAAVLFYVLRTAGNCVLPSGRTAEADRCHHIILTGLPVLVACILAVLFIDRGHTWGGDFSEYIAQAEVLATGHDNPGRPQVGYKYGTALLLLPFFRARGLDLLALKIPMILCFAAFVAIAAWSYQKRFPAQDALPASLLLAASPSLVTYLNNVLSDIPFLLFASLSLLCMQAVYDKKKGSGRRCLWALAAGCCSTYAYSCRFQGIILLLTFACTEALLLLRAAVKKNRLLQAWTATLAPGNLPAHLCFYASCAASYALYVTFLPASPARSDLGFLQDFSLTGLAYNVISYPFFFNDFFSCYGHCPRPICMACYLLWLPLIITGIARKAKDEPVAAIFSLGLLATYIIWPGPQDFRFLFPILPIMLMFALYGFEGLTDSGLKKCYAAAALLTLCIFASSLLFDGAKNLRRGRSGDYQAFSAEAQESYAYIRENTKADERIIFFKPRVLYLTTGRICEGYTKKTEEFNAQLTGFDYILSYREQNLQMPLDKEGYELPQGIRLEEAFTNGSFTLYRIVRAATD